MSTASHTYSDPQRSLELLDALQASGFGDEAFAVIHHHKEPMKIDAHRRYCTMLIEGGDDFKTNNNRLVQQRLSMILTMYRSAGLSSGKEAVFFWLAQAAVGELPHDLRPISEQYLGMSESGRSEA